MEVTSRITFVLLLAGLLALCLIVDGRSNPMYAVIHFAIIALSLVHITRTRRFDMGASFSFFGLFFFGIIPLFEYKLGIAYNGMSAPRDSSYSYAALMALLSSICFYLGYGLRRGRKPDPGPLMPLTYVTGRHRQLVRLFSIGGVLVLPALIAAYYGFDPANLLFRGYGEQIDSSPFGYSVVNYFARPLLFNLIFLIVLVYNSHPHGRRPPVYVLCLVLLFFVSPIGIPRSLAGALYIPIMTVAFFPRLSGKYSIVCLIIFGILFAAPIFDVFRVIQQSKGVDLIANFNLDYLFAGHFDAFYNFVEVVELRYSSAGLQVLGALLFWVPRALWPDKPVGTSFDFAGFAGFRANNVSFPLTADLYVDFGVFGVILGMFFVGILYRRLDAYLSKPRPQGSLSGYIATMAQLELAILGIYLLRGNFLSSFSFTVGVASTFGILGCVNAAVRGWGRSQQSMRAAA